MSSLRSAIFGAAPRAQTLPKMSGRGAAMSPPSMDNIAGAIPGKGAMPMGIFRPPSFPPMQPPEQAQSPLGGSMRQPFDYDGAMKRLQELNKGPSTKEKLLSAAQVIGDIWSDDGGRRGGALANLIQQQQERAKNQRENVMQGLKWQHDDWARQNEADLRAANPFSSGRDRVAYNPASGQSQVVYDGPQDFEIYANEQGLEPGTDDYFRAVEDYVLKSSGPSAHERDQQLDDYRTGNDLRMEGTRQSNRERMEGLRYGNRKTLREQPTYSDLNPRPAARKTARPSATGPNGKKVEWDGKAWVPVG